MLKVDYYENYSKKELQDAKEKFQKDLKRHYDYNDRFELSENNFKAVKAALFNITSKLRKIDNEK